MQALITRDISRALLLTLLTCGMLHSASASSAVEEAIEEAASPQVASRDIQAGPTLYCMALAVYFEGGSSAESEEGQRHIARVIHQRAKANLRKWGGSDVCDVIFYNRAGVCQFSFACLPTAQRTPRGGAA